MPKRLMAVSPHKAALVEYEDRPLAPDQVRVKVEYASPKHGTELADFRAESPFGSDRCDEDWHLFLPREQPAGTGEDPWPLGNQWVGRIAEIGSQVEGATLGERICGYGGIAETQTCRYVHALKMPEGMDWQSAVCYDPAQFALGGILDSHLRLAERVCVIGLGAIGQIAAGADQAFDPTSDDIGLELKKATERHGVDVVLETSASEGALQAALRGLTYGGTIAFLGWARPFKGGLDLGREAHFNNATIVFSRACSIPRRDHPRWTYERIYNSCWRMLASGQIRYKEIIDPVVPFDQCAEAYEEFVDRHPDKSIKLGIRME